MHAAANDPAVASKTGVPQSVAQEFVSAGHGHSVKSLPKKLGKHKKGKRKTLKRNSEHWS